MIFSAGTNSSGGKLSACLDTELFAELAQVNDERPVILSAEDFWLCDPWDIRSSLHQGATKAYQYIVVYATRPFAEWIFSIYKHNTEATAFLPRSIVFSEWLYAVIEEIADFKRQSLYSIYDLERLRVWEQCFKTCRQLRFPPTEPLVELADAIGLRPVPIEWKNLSLHVNQTFQPKPCSIPSSNEELLGDSYLDVDRLVTFARNLGLVGLSDCLYKSRHRIACMFAADSCMGTSKDAKRG